MIQIDVESERISDVSDIATRAEAVATSVALANAKENVMPERVFHDDGTYTVQGKDDNGQWRIVTCACGEDLPEGRMALGKVRCIACQQRVEKRRNGY